MSKEEAVGGVVVADPLVFFEDGLVVVLECGDWEKEGVGVVS